jgi:hypothetical protein
VSADRVVSIPPRDLAAGALVERAVTPDQPWRTELVAVREVDRRADERGTYYLVRLEPGTVWPTSFTLRPADRVKGVRP